MKVGDSPEGPQGPEGWRPQLSCAITVLLPGTKLNHLNMQLPPGENHVFNWSHMM